MAKTIQKEIERSLNINNPQDREIFREKLIAKLKSNRAVKKLTLTQQTDLIAHLSNTKLSESIKHTIYSDRKTKLITTANAAKKLIALLENLDNSEKYILEENWQHSIPYPQIIKAIESVEKDTNLFASKIPTTGVNHPANFIKYLNGASLHDVLSSFSIPITHCNAIPSAEEASPLNLPALSINATAGMLCAMLCLLDAKIENLNWGHAITIIKSAKSVQKGRKHLAKLVLTDNLREQFNSILEEAPPTIRSLTT